MRSSLHATCWAVGVVLSAASARAQDAGGSSAGPRPPSADFARRVQRLARRGDPLASIGQTSNLRESILIAEVVPGAQPLFVSPVPAFAAATVTAAQSGAVFRGSVIPGAFFRDKWLPVLSDLQLSIATDTGADGGLPRTSVAVGVPLCNPYALRSPRANQSARDAALEHWVSCMEAAPSEDEIRACRQRVANSTDCGATDADCNASRAAALDRCGRDVPEDRDVKCNQVVLGRQTDRLFEGAVLVRLAGGVDLYPVGTYTNAMTGAVADTLPLGAVAAQADIAYRPIRRIELSGWGVFRHGRSSGLPNVVNMMTPLGSNAVANYLGGGLQAAFMIAEFLPTASDRARSDVYIRSGFLPGIVLGVSGQIRRCFEAAAVCEKQRTLQWSATMFADFRFTSTVQFRLSLPIVGSTLVSSQSLELTPSFTFGLSVGSSP